MDWVALSLSLQLAAWTVVLLLPVAVIMGRWLAWRQFPAKIWVEAAIMLPLVLPPTVMGYYLLVSLGQKAPLGQLWHMLTGGTLIFSFQGLIVASVIFNLPFAVQPAQRAFEAIAPELREAAQLCGLSPWQRLWRIELPLAWPGLLTGMLLCFAHTLGEFGIVLMVGGSIPGETRTLAISVYDSVQSFDDHGAAIMSAALVGVSLVTILISLRLSARLGRRLS